MQVEPERQQKQPFHPALIDIMRERWSSLSNFQRTRGTLRFLATCLRAAKVTGVARPLLGSGDVPLADVEVRVALIKELGLQNDYDAVITSDIDGPNAKATKIDERLGKETPALARTRPTTRVATALLMHSFGGLLRKGDREGETLPPGVGEMELRAACAAPDLDSTTVTTALSELRNDSLYLHYDGVRYAFKKDPNVTALVEDAEQEVARDAGGVRTRIREMLDKRLAGQRNAIVWPEKSHQIPDEDPQFLIAYLPLEFAGAKADQQEKDAKEIFEKYGDKPRRYRNGVAVAVPDKSQLEPLRRAVRYLLATERVEARTQQLRLSKDQVDQLRERRRTEEHAAESAFRQLYSGAWLPRSEAGAIQIERVEVGGRPLQASGVHERVEELLTTVTPKVFATTTPRKIVELFRLGEGPEEGQPRLMGVRLTEIVDAFYAFLGFPRLTSASVINGAISRGAEQGDFGYCNGAVPTLGPDGRFEVSTQRVAFNRPLTTDEVDIDTGFLMAPNAVPAPEAPTPAQPLATGTPGPDYPSQGPVSATQTRTDVAFSFDASRDQVFKAFSAIANLADKSSTGKVKLNVEAHSDEGFDAIWLRNAVMEPLSEAELLDDEWPGPTNSSTSISAD